MEQQIRQELETIARDNGFRILYACEAGSRAWGFPSPDSDYDIRFLYVHPLDNYLGIEESRDTFEAMLPNDHDFTGWELRKALRLFAAGNTGLFEQLRSSVVYVDEGALRERLADLISGYFNPKRSILTYLKTAQQHMPGEAVSDRLGIKRFFNVLRPLLACEWIIAHRTMPPTEMQRLLYADSLPPELREELFRLVRRKAAPTENEALHPSGAVLEWIDATLPRIRDAVEQMEAPPKCGTVVPLNAIFRDMICP